MEDKGEFRGEWTSEELTRERKVGICVKGGVGRGLTDGGWEW